MLDKLRIKDIVILKNLGSCHSIRELARQMSLDPQNLTKRIAYIEEVLGNKIMERSVTGYTLNEYGQSVIEKSNQVEKILNSLTQEEMPERTLKVCSRAYLVDYFIDEVMFEFERSLPGRTFELMDSLPELMERVARKGQLDILLSFNDVFLGDNFVKKEVGKIRWGFFAHSDHDLVKTRKIVDDFKGAPLVGFCYFDADRVFSRKSPLLSQVNAGLGHHVENSRYSIKVIRQSDSVAYLPTIAAREDIEYGHIKEIKVDESLKEERTVYLQANIDRLTNKELSALEKILRRTLKG